MNARHRKTLAALFANQRPRTIPFRDIESLLKAVGCAVEERAGSRVVFGRAGAVWATHRPHPGREARPYHVAGARSLLEKLGVKP